MGSLFAFYSLGFWTQAQLLISSYHQGTRTDRQTCFAGCYPDSPGCLTVGKGISVFFCIAFGSFSLGQAAPPLNAVVKGRSAVCALREVIARVSEIPNMEKPTMFEPLVGAISFVNVCFSYKMTVVGQSPEDRWVFKDLNFAIHPGEIVAFVGPSGCGKSTIAKLILRFVDSTSGVIVIDNT